MTAAAYRVEIFLLLLGFKCINYERLSVELTKANSIVNSVHRFARQNIFHVDKNVLSAHCLQAIAEISTNRYAFAYPEQYQRNPLPFYLPTDGVIDTESCLLLKTKDSEIIDVRRIKVESWIYPEDTESASKSSND